MCVFFHNKNKIHLNVDYPLIGLENYKEDKYDNEYKDDYKRDKYNDYDSDSDEE